MGVGDKNVGDDFTAHSVEQSCDVHVVIGTRVEDGNFAVADNVANRALERERPGIVGDDRAHGGRYFRRATRDEVERLVVVDIVAHAEVAVPSFLSPSSNPISSGRTMHAGIRSARPVPRCSRSGLRRRIGQQFAPSFAPVVGRLTSKRDVWF